MTEQPAPYRDSHRLSVAPMIDWTDRHCRFMLRLFSRHSLLYTEMVAAPAVLRGPRARLLDYDAAEHPLALQLGGSDPQELAEAVRIAADWGYDEINLNVGCPSDRVQSGSFGACLMREPAVVAACVAAMARASRSVGGPPITVKCRIGVDEQDPYQALPDFIATVASAGARSFTVHARKAWLKGLSPKENRTIPPLDYDLPLRVKRAWPDLQIILNGGVDSLDAAEAHLATGLDGVMIGRAAYHDPAAILRAADRRIFGAADDGPDAEAVARAMLPYIESRMTAGDRFNAIARHMLTLFNGRTGAKRYRRALSETMTAPGAGPHTLEAALTELG